MPTINVDGVGPLNFPDDMSQDDISEAIQNHPKVKELVNNQSAGGQWQNLANNTGRAVGSAVSHMPFVNEIGEKTLGAKIEDSPEIQQWQKDHPWLDALSNVGGKTAAAVPAAMGAEALGGGMAAYTGLMGLYNMAGTAAHKGKDYSPKDALWDVGSAGLGAGIGKALSKAISPTYVRPKGDPIAPAPVSPEAVPSATPTSFTTPLPQGVTPRSGLTPAEQSSLGNGNGFNPSRATQTPKQTLDQIMQAHAAGKSMAQIQAETEAKAAADAATAANEAQHAKELAAVKSQNEAAEIAAKNKTGLSSHLGELSGGLIGGLASHALGGGPVGDVMAALLGARAAPSIGNAASKYLGPVYRNNIIKNHPNLLPLLQSLGQGGVQAGREGSMTNSLMRALGH